VAICNSIIFGGSVTAILPLTFQHKMAYSWGK
jgi:hypothetical protein